MTVVSDPVGVLLIVLAAVVYRADRWWVCRQRYRLGLRAAAGLDLREARRQGIA